MDRDPMTGDYAHWRMDWKTGERIYRREPIPEHWSLKHGNGDSYSWARNGEDD